MRPLPTIPGGITAQVDRFITDRCVVHPSRRLTRLDLDRAYRAWLDDNPDEVRPHMIQWISEFVKRFGEPPFQQSVKLELWQYHGVGLAP